MTTPWSPDPLAPAPWVDPLDGDVPGYEPGPEQDELGPDNDSPFENDDSPFGNPGWPVELAGPEFWMWLDRLRYREP